MEKLKQTEDQEDNSGTGGDREDEIGAETKFDSMPIVRPPVDTKCTKIESNYGQRMLDGPTKSRRKWKP